MKRVSKALYVNVTGDWDLLKHNNNHAQCPHSEINSRYTVIVS